MGQEVNIGLIMALERRIEDGEGDIIKLKRARNSLLNISTRMPPEILGIIFAWIVTREQDDSVFSTAHFAGLEKGSHNFLLVCHRWLEAASQNFGGLDVLGKDSRGLGQTVSPRWRRSC